MATLHVKKGNGLIYYKIGGYESGHAPDRPWSSGGPGGLRGGGWVWTGFPQLIRIGGNGLLGQYIWLKEGWNEIEFFIPFIYPKDVWLPNVQITIESDGYILIPAGFTWEVLYNDKVDKLPPNSKMIERIDIKDIYDLVIEHNIEREIKGLDDFSLEDFIDIVKQRLPQTYHIENIDDIDIKDFIEKIVINTVKSTTEEKDEISLEDIVEIEMHKSPTAQLDGAEDEIEIEDILDIKLQTTRKIEIEIEEEIEIESEDKIEIYKTPTAQLDSVEEEVEIDDILNIKLQTTRKRELDIEEEIEIESENSIEAYKLPIAQLDSAEDKVEIEEIVDIKLQNTNKREIEVIEDISLIERGESYE